MPQLDRSIPSPIWLRGLLVTAVIGCSGGHLKLYPVKGLVMCDGTPLAVGSVTLQADSSKGNGSLEIAGGKVHDGKYEIYTGQRRGAPLGWYKVLVVSTNFSGDNPRPKGPTADMPRSLIDTRFSDSARTPLTFEVVAKPPTGSYDLQVTKGPP